MTDLRKAAEQALEALEEIDGCPRGVDQATIPKAGIEAAPKQVVFNMSIGLLRLRKAQKAVEALRQALAQEENEPVGFFSINDYGNWEENENGYGTPLYTAPPKQEWDGPTDEEYENFCSLIQREEAKLKEKNGG